MNTGFQDFKNKELTDRIIRVLNNVYNTLGYGFIEKAYDNYRR